MENCKRKCIWLSRRGAVDGFGVQIEEKPLWNAGILQATGDPCIYMGEMFLIALLDPRAND